MKKNRKQQLKMAKKQIISTFCIHFNKTHRKLENNCPVIVYLQQLNVICKTTMIY